MKTHIISKRVKCGGFIWIVISILVIVVGGVVIYQLSRLLHNLNNKPKNDDTTYYSDGQGDTWSAVKKAALALAIQSPSPSLETPADLCTNSFCTFQYRVLMDSNNVPYTSLVMGTNMVDGQQTVLINTPDEFEVTFIVAGQTYLEDYDANTGDTLNEVITPAYTGNPVTGIVQRMGEGGWSNIYTNDPCQVGIIYTFTDPCPPADCGLYRLLIQ